MAVHRQFKILLWVNLAFLVCTWSALESARIVIVAAYQFLCSIGLRPLLDWLFRRYSSLRGIFRLHLGEEKSRQRHIYKHACDLIGSLGLECEEHHAVTRDGYILGLQRLRLPVLDEFVEFNSYASGSNDSDPKSASSEFLLSNDGRATRPPVLLQHGLMQNSESFICNGENSLALILLEAGFDVWLGNNRGNKYSCNHIKLDPRSSAFWDFCIDDLAREDLPAMIDYILNVTNTKSLGYVGFSQGTAQMFAALSSQPALRTKVNSFCALSAAYAMKGLARSALASLVEADINFIYLMFGHRSMLSSTLTWQRILSSTKFSAIIDRSVSFLFGWSMRNLDPTYKPRLYQHLYSLASVKNVVHWFQILRERKFQMHLDSSARPAAIPAAYDASAIQVPMACFVGGADTLLDIRKLVSKLPLKTYIYFEPHYEHLDFTWARGAADPGRAFESVAAFLQSHSPDAVAFCDSNAIKSRFHCLFPRLLLRERCGGPVNHHTASDDTTKATLEQAEAFLQQDISSHDVVHPPSTTQRVSAGCADEDARRDMSSKQIVHQAVNSSCIDSHQLAIAGFLRLRPTQTDDRHAVYHQKTKSEDMEVSITHQINDAVEAVNMLRTSNESPPHLLNRRQAAPASTRSLESFDGQVVQTGTPATLGGSTNDSATTSVAEDADISPTELEDDVYHVYATGGAWEWLPELLDTDIPDEMHDIYENISAINEAVKSPLSTTDVRSRFQKMHHMATIHETRAYRALRAACRNLAED